MKHADRKLLVFAHMMKTAGTSLSRQLAAHFGRRMHIVPGGLKMNDDYYDGSALKKDLDLFNHRLEIIAGHPMRPYIDFGEETQQEMLWFTFFREPKKRYVSHYLHDFNWTNSFSSRRYRHMKEKSIVEWEELEDFSNYQTKFIAGEDNVDKAIEILETKFSWLGLTEEYETSMLSFKVRFDLQHLYTDTKATNTNLANKDTTKEVHDTYSEFIAEKNQNDIRLYAYVKNQIWPKYRKLTVTCENRTSVKPKGRSRRALNTILFHINRQRAKESKVNLRNLKRFYNRWYR